MQGKKTLLIIPGDLLNVSACDHGGDKKMFLMQFPHIIQSLLLWHVMKKVGVV